MVSPRQFSLAYLFLEIFWIAMTLGLAKWAHWLYWRCGIYDYWNPPISGVLFAALVIGAWVTGSTAVGRLFGQMRRGAKFAVWTLVGLVILSALWVVITTRSVE